MGHLGVASTWGHQGYAAAGIYISWTIHAFWEKRHPRRMRWAIGLVSGRPTEMSPELPGSESALLGCLLRSRMRAVIFRGAGTIPGAACAPPGAQRRSRVRLSSIGEKRVRLSSIRGRPCDPGCGRCPSGADRVRFSSIGVKRVRRMSIERRKTAPNGQEPNPGVLDGRNTNPDLLNGCSPNPDLLDGRTPNLVQPLRNPVHPLRIDLQEIRAPER